MEGLRNQSLPAQQWELLLVDNASKISVGEWLDVSWHPLARHTFEGLLGLTNARLCGIQEAKGELLVFIDDDNILEPDYLEIASKIYETHPFLGAWAGSCLGEFEEAPPGWAAEYLCYLAVRVVDRERWTNLPDFNFAPVGGGMCVKREIARTYAKRVHASAVRRDLDRKGESLTSGGDSDLAFTACEMGKGIGLFPSMRLTHIIPKARLEIHYLERLMEGISYSTVLLSSLHGLSLGIPEHRLPDRWIHQYRLFRQPSEVRRLEAARRRGFERGRHTLDDVR